MRRVGLAALLMLVASAGCRGSATSRSAEEAYVRLLDAADQADAALLFDALDTETRWSIETVLTAQREMRQLIIESYPGPERDRALARLPAGCEEPLARRYYRRLDDSGTTLAEIKKRMYAGTGQPVGSVRGREGVADVWREGGSVFRFARDEKGGWGFMELRPVWARAKERALHDVETVRQNVALYQRVPRAAGR